MSITEIENYINKIICGDCIEIMEGLQDKSVDLILTDPPYGVEIEYDIYKDTENNWFDLMNKFIPEAKRVGKMVIFPNARIRRMKWFYNNFEPDWWIVWDKGSPGIRSPIGFNDYELLCVYGKNNPTAMHDVMRVNNTEKMGNHKHPCPKPVRWAKWLISRASRGGGYNFRPFLWFGNYLCSCTRFRTSVYRYRHFV